MSSLLDHPKNNIWSSAWTEKTRGSIQLRERTICMAVVRRFFGVMRGPKNPKNHEGFIVHHIILFPSSWGQTCISPSIPMSYLVGSFNPFETYSSNWIIAPGRGKNKKCLKPPPSMCFFPTPPQNPPTMTHPPKRLQDTKNGLREAEGRLEPSKVDHFRMRGRRTNGVFPP